MFRNYKHDMSEISEHETTTVHAAVSTSALLLLPATADNPINVHDWLHCTGVGLGLFPNRKKVMLSYTES